MMSEKSTDIHKKPIIQPNRTIKIIIHVIEHHKAPDNALLKFINIGIENVHVGVFESEFVKKTTRSS